mmetsp:Transcript_8536/g.13568  ORF Transcript_8536/g.13568 Transcript_8536/m.13568 type:complete len:83 (+) Transcript_8536:475-723(+)
MQAECIGNGLCGSILLSCVGAGSLYLGYFGHSFFTHQPSLCMLHTSALILSIQALILTFYIWTLIPYISTLFHTYFGIHAHT